MSARLPYLALVLTAFLYGATFVVVKDAIEILPPFGFVGWRFLLGAIPLLLIGRPRGYQIWRDGLVAGILLFAGFGLQTEGLAQTSAANSGLITGLYVVFTPFLASALAKRWTRWQVFGGAAIAFAGFAFLTEGFSPQRGDVLTVGCALAFAAHIVALTRLAPRHPALAFTATQVVVVSALAFAVAVPREGLIAPSREVIGALLLTGLVVSAGAFYLQVWAQGRVGSARTAIILALESVFAVLFAAVWAGDRLTVAGWIGAVLIVGAIYIVLIYDDEPEVTAAESVSLAS